MLMPNDNLSLLKKDIVFLMQHPQKICFIPLSFGRILFFDKKEFNWNNVGCNLAVYYFTS